MNTEKNAEELHENVPDGWYYYSIRENIFQRYWHRRRFEEIGKLILSVKDRVLDVGASDGMFTSVILKETSAREIIAIDVLHSSIAWAKKHWKKNKKIKFMVADAHKLPFKAQTFDAVFALEMLEHVFSPEKVLLEIKRVMKRGGYAVFLVPSDSNLFKFIWFLWGFYRGRVWKHTHIQTYRSDYLVKISDEVGFKVEISKKFLLGMLHAVRVRKI